MKNTNVFKCADCPDVREMDYIGFSNHMSLVHKLDVTKLKCKKQMVMHMDGDKWFSSQYKYTTESGLVFHQFTTTRRSKSDPMYH